MHSTLLLSISFRLSTFRPAQLSEERQQSSSFIAGATVIYIALGFLVFIFLPSALLSYLEGWTYVDAVYYSYITLTTIGFGDLVPGGSWGSVWLLFG